jgi:hypothetical protein
MQETYLGKYYSCVADNLNTTLDDREIKDIEGTHLAGKTNDDVIKLFIKKHFFPYLPLKVGL